MSSKACPEVSQSLVGNSHAASTIDCGDPSNASSEVIVQYTSTIVGSVIFYWCQQSGFAPSSLSAVCMESGRWSPDPSQVFCRMVTTTMSTMSTTTGREMIGVLVGWLFVFMFTLIKLVNANILNRQC